MMICLTSLLQAKLGLSDGTRVDAACSYRQLLAAHAKASNSDRLAVSMLSEQGRLLHYRQLV